MPATAAAMRVTAGSGPRASGSGLRITAGTASGAFCWHRRLEMNGRTERLRQELGADLAKLLDACTTSKGGAREAAWERLLEAVRQMALDLGRRCYHLAPEDAEDVAQLAQLRVLEHL